MRYRISLSYLGTKYSGWQKQPGDLTVQQILEEAFTTILREPVELVGCGRTDAGVHARNYTAHFDAGSIQDIDKTLYQVNAILPTDVAVSDCIPTSDTFHSRFDALERGYVYSMHLNKDPFLQDQSFFLSSVIPLDQAAMHHAASIIKSATSFKPFCKTGSDNKGYECFITESKWRFDEHNCSYEISANRFLRGMVRLIVGACINVGLHKISVEELQHAIDTQTPLSQPWSVPAHGLCFMFARYPET